MAKDGVEMEQTNKYGRQGILVSFISCIAKATYSARDSYTGPGMILLLS